MIMPLLTKIQDFHQLANPLQVALSAEVYLAEAEVELEANLPKL